MEDEYDIEMKLRIDRRENNIKNNRKGNEDTRNEWSVPNGKKVLRLVTRGSTGSMTKRITSWKRCLDLSVIFQEDGKGEGKWEWRVKRAIAPCRLCFLPLKNTHIQWTSNVSRSTSISINPFRWQPACDTQFCTCVYVRVYARRNTNVSCARARARVNVCTCLYTCV